MKEQERVKTEVRNKIERGKEREREVKRDTMKAGKCGK